MSDAIEPIFNIFTIFSPSEYTIKEISAQEFPSVLCRVGAPKSLGRIIGDLSLTDSHPTHSGSMTPPRHESLPFSAAILFLKAGIPHECSQTANPDAGS
jgi:hypothetical protein